MTALPRHIEAEWTPPPGEADEHFDPQSEEQLLWALRSWRWRIYSGRLYKIMVKGKTADGEEDDSVTFVLPFIPNAAQRQFLEDAHSRNVILKARQLGFSTLICILWLDHALFNADQRCEIIANTLTEAEKLLRDKVRFAYDNLPASIRACFPIKKDTAEEILFGHNNSNIRVSTSARGGTVHRLHISEMGKIAAQFPKKSAEIITGSFPAVPLTTGVIVVESTAEGQEGDFYDIAQAAEKLAEMGRFPKPSEWMFHFFPWWGDDTYETDPEGVKIAAADHQYFDQVEREMGCTIGPRKRAWYIGYREGTMFGNAERMWREMPSTPKECWKASLEGKFYSKEMSRARVEGRIGIVPHVTSVPVHTFWDIGAGDGTGIWLMQQLGAQHRFIRYIEAWGEGYAHFVKRLRDTGWVFGVHHLPHDAMQKRQLAMKVGSPMEALQELAPDWTFTIVPRVGTIQHGIEMVRAKFSQAWFDEQGCEAGLHHLDLYGKKWNQSLGVWSHEPEKLTGHSEAADSFRQWAQGYSPEILSGPQRPTRKRTGGRVL